MEIRYLTNDNGEKTHVILSIDDYETLTDAIMDHASAMDLIRARYLIGRVDEGNMPEEVASRLLLGENPIKVWREYRKMRKMDLAAATDVNRRTINKLESGKMGIPLDDSTQVIANALDISVEDLFSPLSVD